MVRLTDTADSRLPTVTAQLSSPRICIVGGGFGGLYTALYLQKYRHLKNSHITLVEPREQFVFSPMMYELITDELKQWELFPTYSRLLAGTSIRWQQARAEAIDLQQQTVSLSDGKQLAYDYLVVATGAESRTLPISGLQDHALTFRSFQDVLVLNERLASLVRAHSLKAQTARLQGPPKGKSQMQTAEPIAVTIVGGGVSGVELACKIADYLGDRSSITLVDRGDTLLAQFPLPMRQQAHRALTQRRVRQQLNTEVAAISANTVRLHARSASDSASGNADLEIPSQLTLWAVGTQPCPWLGEQPVSQNDQGQWLTRRTLQLVAYDNVFVLGDSADVRGPNGKAAPNTAQAAFQAASRVAANLAAMTKGRSPKTFNYFHLGDMMTLGVGNASVHSFGLTLGGRFAALIRRGVYVFRMPTRRHQLRVGRRAIAELLRALL